MPKGKKVKLKKELNSPLYGKTLEVIRVSGGKVDLSYDGDIAFLGLDIKFIK